MVDRVAEFSSCEREEEEEKIMFFLFCLVGEYIFFFLKYIYERNIKHQTQISRVSVHIFLLPIFCSPLFLVFFLYGAGNNRQGIIKEEKKRSCGEEMSSSLNLAGVLESSCCGRRPRREQ